MHDSELRKLLVETCPVRPGQEERAWAALKDRLYANPAAASHGWLSYINWRWTTAGLATVLAIAALIANQMYVAGLPEPISIADSEAPGIYATCFYSSPAHAQVVWLNGLDPANNGLTYMDPTTTAGSLGKAGSANNPNSL